MTYETQLDETQKKLRDLEFALNESAIVAITDSKGIIQFANDKFCHISKYRQQELIGSNQNIVNSGYHSNSFFKELWTTIGAGNVWHGEIKNRAKDGTYYWVDTTIVPFLNDQGKPYQYTSIRYDITTRKAYEEYIEEMAYYDALTHLPNRNQLYKWVDEHPRKTDETYTVFFLDLDNFKIINDNFGHGIGDKVLEEVSGRLRACLRESDFVSRQGGDEFIVILENNTDKDTAMCIARKILDTISLPIYINDKEMSTTVSIGINNETLNKIPENCQEFIETSIKKADTAMYHAKKNGGNNFCFSTPDQNMEMDRKFQMELELKNALASDEFKIVYQPLINLKNNQIVGVEALLRWKNKELGSVSPIEFIPILEKTGQIIQVGKWILWSVCNQMKMWQENGTYLERISVNVSPIQFKDKKFVQDLKQIINETELDASYIELEITEGTILEIENVSQTLHDLQELGVKVSIDDFGTGYSSLSYLKQLPIDTLKIDKSFIDDLDMDGEIIVNTIISMGKNLRFRVIAEGIETPQQLNYLKKQECHEGQGYYFSRPVNDKEIALLYKKLQSK
ncbi:EAL and GGDEF domain-containing protein [Oceanobacillus bengalensis]|uniref:sensor domain-containing protein n=1 Tax=Oceanobacillus bengalensis TaxID=1435466 RepID=UPI001FE78981|nr:EAL domain-containing protein [Oceanobacillus bengalensis]